MVMQRVLLALLLGLARAAPEVGVWPYDYFHGFMPFPEAWGSMWSLRDVTTAYFVGSETGPDDEAEIVKESKWGIIGLGWQLGALAGNWTDVEALELSTARRIRARNTSTKVLVARNIEVLAPFLSVVRKIWDRDDFWLKCGGEVCTGAWTGDAGVSIEKKWMDFGNADLRDWYLNEYMAFVYETPEIDGAHFDCSCGRPPDATVPTDYGFWKNKTMFEMNDRLKEAKKWGTAWAGDGVVNTTPHKGDACAPAVRSLQRTAKNAAHTTQFQWSGGGEGLGLGMGIAAFLVARSEDSTLVTRVRGAYDTSVDDYTDFEAHMDLLHHDFGVPSGDATEETPGVFVRDYPGGRVTLDCVRYNYTIEM